MESPACTQSGVTRCERCARVLDVLVPEVVLQGPGVMAIIGQLEATGVAQHVRVDREWHLGGLPEALDKVLYTETAPDRFKYGGDLGLGQLAHSFLPLAISRCGLGTCVRHGFNPARMLQLHLLWHQQGADLQVSGRLRLAHFRNGLLPVFAEVA